MLEELPALQTTKIVYRFGNRRDYTSAARHIGLDDQATQELLQFVGSDEGPVDVNELLTAPFQEKRQFQQHPTRYSDGSWPVFYSALERETSEKEIVHHYVRAAIGNPSENRRVFYSAFHCQFSGEVRDLRPKQSVWRELTSPNTNNPFCQDLGREAVEAEVDAFLAPSARAPEGTTVPVFTSKSLSDAEIDGEASFTFDNAQRQFVVTYVP